MESHRLGRSLHYLVGTVSIVARDSLGLPDCRGGLVNVGVEGVCQSEWTIINGRGACLLASGCFQVL